MTAPSKVSGAPRNAIRARDVLRAGRFPVSDGAPVEVAPAKEGQRRASKTPAPHHRPAETAAGPGHVEAWK